MTSAYLNKPQRTKREAEIDRLCAELKEDHRYDKTDGHLQSVRRLLDYAQICALRHHAGLALMTDASDTTEDLIEGINVTIADNLAPALREAKDYFDREEERQIAGMR